MLCVVLSQKCQCPVWPSVNWTIVLCIWLPGESQGSQMAERWGESVRWGSRASNPKVAGSIPRRAQNDVVSLGKALHPTYLGGGECPCIYCKSLWIRASAKWLNVNVMKDLNLNYCTGKRTSLVSLTDYLDQESQETTSMAELSVQEALTSCCRQSVLDVLSSEWGLQWLAWLTARNDVYRERWAHLCWHGVSLARSGCI